MSRLIRGAAALCAAVAGLIVVAPVASAHGPEGLDAVGLAGAGTELVAFRTDDPASAALIGPITGLTGDTRLVGIDYRVQNDRLYGLGDAGGVYLVDDRTAAAENVGQLTVALNGTFFGIDFNPAENLLRVVGDAGQNLRQPFGAGDAPAGATVADSNLNRSGQGMISLSPATGVTDIAYINNDTHPRTGSVAGVYDTAEDRLAVLFPEAKGVLRGIGAPGTLPEVSGDTGADVYSHDLYDDMRDDDAFATVLVGTEYRLLAVDLKDSQFHDRGAFPTDVLDLAIATAQ